MRSLYKKNENFEPNCSGVQKDAGFGNVSFKTLLSIWWPGDVYIMDHDVE